MALGFMVVLVGLNWKKGLAPYNFAGPRTQEPDTQDVSHSGVL